MSLPLSPSQKSLILRVINCFETGSPEGNYSALSIYADGPHGIRQITYGRSQVTEYGNLKRLVSLYVKGKGIFAGELGKYLGDIGSVPLVDDKGFKALLRSAGRKDPVMAKVQDAFFEDAYFKPALKWASKANCLAFRTQRGLCPERVTLYDSFIHSGSILKVIRRKFPEVPPSKGGKEKPWIQAYVKARHEWLLGSRKKFVRASSYRTKDLMKMIEDKNWNLDKLPLIANGIEVYPE
ncbi:MAG TPA: chitosanase [Acidobacteriota bacterium]|nr:chitosanase [Acidobacteriota bacterium]HNT18211.1 chitosanase [Acidobacteriota bacterium]